MTDEESKVYIKSIEELAYLEFKECVCQSDIIYDIDQEVRNLCGDANNKTNLLLVMKRQKHF